MSSGSSLISVPFAGGNLTAAYCPSTLRTRPTGIDLTSSTNTTSLNKRVKILIWQSKYRSIHDSSSFLESLSSFGAARLFVLLCDVTLPVSLHVLDAGEGGGGMSNLSAVSLLLPDDFDDEPDETGVDGIMFDDGIADFNKSFKSFEVRLLDAGAVLGNGGMVISLNRQVSVRSHAAVNNCPTRGTPFEIVKPIAPVTSGELALARTGFFDLALCLSHKRFRCPNGMTPHQNNAPLSIRATVYNVHVYKETIFSSENSIKLVAGCSSLLPAEPSSSSIHVATRFCSVETVQRIDVAEMFTTQPGFKLPLPDAGAPLARPASVPVPLVDPLLDWLRSLRTRLYNKLGAGTVTNDLPDELLPIITPVLRDCTELCVPLLLRTCAPARNIRARDLANCLEVAVFFELDALFEILNEVIRENVTASTPSSCQAVDEQQNVMKTLRQNLYGYLILKLQSTHYKINYLIFDFSVRSIFQSLKLNIQSPFCAVCTRCQLTFSERCNSFIPFDLGFEQWDYGNITEFLCFLPHQSQQQRPRRFIASHIKRSSESSQSGHSDPPNLTTDKSEKGTSPRVNLILNGHEMQRFHHDRHILESFRFHQGANVKNASNQQSQNRIDFLKSGKSISLMFLEPKRQSQTRKTVSMGRTSANKQINHLVVITASGNPNLSNCWFICGTRLFNNSFKTSMSVMRPVIVLLETTRNAHPNFTTLRKDNPTDAVTLQKA
ncbi:hypothetical protein Bhyg_13467 [Pseudolycoriella hygida]|uniref:Uncharacterized protein n=1 Tax=Pseudolycoriella hygida TaxID=35572 RepID=A0A9Q0RWC9_9DIPT|nr:hypothetical protein Bhyg_13467 [Pseudolycoriella hygida]